MIAGGGVPLQHLHKHIRDAHSQTSPLHPRVDGRLSDLGRPRPGLDIRDMGRSLQRLANSNNNHGPELFGDGGDVRCIHQLLE